jgi:hypothetical protein
MEDLADKIQSVSPNKAAKHFIQPREVVSHNHLHNLIGVSQKHLKEMCFYENIYDNL